MSQWEHVDIDPCTEVEISNLDNKLMYAFKLQAKSMDGCYGELSETKVTPLTVPIGKFSNASV